MKTENLVLPDPIIYDSLEVLDDYLRNVRIRREQRRQVRLEAERLHVAIAKVREELEASQQDGDTEITLELQYVLQEFEARLEKLQPFASQAVVPAAPPFVPDQPLEIEPRVAELPLHEEPKIEIAVCPVTESPSAEVEQQEPLSDAEIISDEEREAQTHNWLAEIEVLSTRWNELDKEGLRLKDKLLNRPACFRMRALACTLARIQTHAEDMGMESTIKKEATELRDKMEFARTYAGDTSNVLPFDEPAWTHVDSRLSIEEWEELAPLYIKVAEAQEIFDWYCCMREELSKGTQQSLLNAIGAVQQMLFRTLEDFAGSDKLQADLYGRLRDAAINVGYLVSLNADTPWAELEQIASVTPALYQKASQEAAGAKEKREKETQKTAAIQAVLQWHQGGDLHNKDVASVAEACKQLMPLLDACIAAGIPPTNVQVRGALLKVAPTLLKDLPPYAKFLDAVLAERKRKGMDLIPIPEAEDTDVEEDLPDVQVTESKEWLSLIVEGQKVLILGGSARPQVAQKLKELLGCAEAEWVDSKKGDRMSKFKTLISRTDVVVVVKKFASHEMTEKGRDWAKELEKMFVLLPSGYGVNQIIRQMYLQLVQTDASKKIVVSTPKSRVSNIASLNLC